MLLLPPRLYGGGFVDIFIGQLHSGNDYQMINSDKIVDKDSLDHFL